MPRPATSRATWRNRWRRASPDIPPTGLAKGRVRCDRDAYTGGMSDTQLLLLLLVAVCAAIVLLVVLLLRKPGLALEAALREEQRDGHGELRQQLDSLSSAQAQRIEGFGARLTEFSTRTDQRLDVLREALTEDARKARSEGADLQQRFADTLGQRLAELTQRNEQRIGEMRTTLESQLQKLQADNAQKLEQMRATVDEKLQSTLNTRLDASFKLVSERLEAVQRGLGEMQQLAVGVGDLKRVLGNVKTRGTLGEVQLGALLEQVLTIEQYETHCVPVPGSSERVEFAVKLPGTHAAQPIRLRIARSAHRRGRTEGVSPCRSRVSLYHSKKKINIY